MEDLVDDEPLRCAQDVPFAVCRASVWQWCIRKKRFLDLASQLALGPIDFRQIELHVALWSADCLTYVDLLVQFDRFGIAPLIHDHESSSALR